MHGRFMRLSGVTCLLALAQSSCFLFSPRTIVRLVNTAASPVAVELYFADEQDLPAALIELTGTERNVTVPAGDSATFSRDCADLQAIFIKDADLNIFGNLGPEEDTRVYREPGDFRCGDLLTFTFSQNATATDLLIDFDRQSGLIGTAP